MTRGGGLLRVAPFLLLAACSSRPGAPVGLTADDQQQLNEAGAMLDADSMAPRAVLTNESTAP